MTLIGDHALVDVTELTKVYISSPLSVKTHPLNIMQILNSVTRQVVKIDPNISTKIPKNTFLYNYN